MVADYGLIKKVLCKMKKTTTGKVYHPVEEEVEERMCCQIFIHFVQLLSNSDAIDILSIYKLSGRREPEMRN